MLYKKQHTAFFCPERYSFIEASTKAGKTHGAITWLFEQAFLNGAKGRNFWWVAPVVAQAKIAFRRMCRAIPVEMRKVNLSEMTITIANDAVITFKSGEIPDNLYGDDVWAIVLDEASRMREEAFHACRSTLTATNGPMRIVGNVKGRKNWFYVLSRRAQGGEHGMRWTKITAYDAIAGGVLDQKEIDDAKSVLPESVFRELYLAEPSDDGGNPFGVKYIERAYRPNEPRGKTESYGGDLAKSFDYTVLTGLDGCGVQSYFDRWQGSLSGTTQRIAAQVKGVKCAIDATGLGVMPAESLQAQGDNYIPVTFTQKTKQALLESLVVAIQRGEIIITDETTFNELMEFEFEHTRTGIVYSAPPGLHDDCVIALALANYAKGQRLPEWGFTTA